MRVVDRQGEGCSEGKGAREGVGEVGETGGVDLLRLSSARAPLLKFKDAVPSAALRSLLNKSPRGGDPPRRPASATVRPPRRVILGGGVPFGEPVRTSPRRRVAPASSLPQMPAPPPISDASGQAQRASPADTPRDDDCFVVRGVSAEDAICLDSSEGEEDEGCVGTDAPTPSPGPEWPSENRVSSGRRRRRKRRRRTWDSPPDAFPEAPGGMDNWGWEGAGSFSLGAHSRFDDFNIFQ